MRLSCTDTEIRRFKDFGVTSLTFWGHVTSSVTWPLELKPSVYLAPLRRYSTSKIMGSRVWPFGVTWRHRSRDYSTRHMWFPIDGPLEPCVYVARYTVQRTPTVYSQYSCGLHDNTTKAYRLATIHASQHKKLIGWSVAEIWPFEVLPWRLFDAQVSLNLENWNLDRRNLRSVIKISYAASPCLSQFILEQFALEICVAARNRQKSIKTSILAFKVIQGYWIRRQSRASVRLPISD